MIKVASTSDPSKMREEKIELRKGIKLLIDEEDDDYLVNSYSKSTVTLVNKSNNTSGMNNTNTSVGSNRSKGASQHLFRDDLILNHQNI